MHRDARSTRSSVAQRTEGEPVKYIKPIVGEAKLGDYALLAIRHNIRLNQSGSRNL
jgi:hypothetical protein